MVWVQDLLQTSVLITSISSHVTRPAKMFIMPGSSSCEVWYIISLVHKRHGQNMTWITHKGNIWKKFCSQAHGASNVSRNTLLADEPLAGFSVASFFALRSCSTKAGVWVQHYDTSTRNVHCSCRRAVLAYGLRRKRTPLLRSGFLCCVHGRFCTLGPAGRTTDWISVELIKRVTSGLDILAVGRL